jgi:hypothetical protein
MASSCLGPLDRPTQPLPGDDVHPGIEGGRHDLVTATTEPAHELSADEPTASNDHDLHRLLPGRADRLCSAPSEVRDSPPPDTRLGTALPSAALSNLRRAPPGFLVLPPAGPTTGAPDRPPARTPGLFFLWIGTASPDDPRGDARCRGDHQLWNPDLPARRARCGGIRRILRALRAVPAERHDRRRVRRRPEGLRHQQGNHPLPARAPTPGRFGEEAGQGADCRERAPRPAMTICPSRGESWRSMPGCIRVGRTRHQTRHGWSWCWSSEGLRHREPVLPPG